MRAEITDSGQMLVIPESSAEEFGLREWQKQQSGAFRDGNVVCVTYVPPPGGEAPPRADTELLAAMLAILRRWDERGMPHAHDP